MVQTTMPKNNDDENSTLCLFRKMSTIISVVVVILGWGLAFGMYNSKIKDACEKANEARTIVRENEIVITKMAKDIEYIRETVQEIKKEIKDENYASQRYTGNSLQAKEQ